MSISKCIHTYRIYRRNEAFFAVVVFFLYCNSSFRSHCEAASYIEWEDKQGDVVSLCLVFSNTMLVLRSTFIQFHLSLQRMKFQEMPIHFSYIFLSVFTLGALNLNIFASSECLSRAT